MKVETATWRAGPFTVVTKSSRSAAGIAVYDKRGKRLYHSKFRWGPISADAVAMAVYSKNPGRLASRMWYSFARIDRYVDGPSFLDAWSHAELVSVQS